MTRRIRKNTGSMPSVKRVLWVCEVGDTVGCVFHDLYGVDFCEAVDPDDIDYEDESGRLLPRAEKVKALAEMAIVHTREPVEV